MIGVVHVAVPVYFRLRKDGYIIRSLKAKTQIVLSKDFKNDCPGIVRQHYYCQGRTFDDIAGVKSWLEIAKKGKQCTEMTRQAVQNEKRGNNSANIAH